MWELGGGRIYEIKINFYKGQKTKIYSDYTIKWMKNKYNQESNNFFKKSTNMLQKQKIKEKYMTYQKRLEDFVANSYK